MSASHSSWSAFKIPGTEVHAGARGRTMVSAFLISVVCSMSRGSLLTGSVPLSSIHFSSGKELMNNVLKVKRL